MKQQIKNFFVIVSLVFAATQVFAAEYLVKYKNRAGLKQVSQVASTNFGMKVLEQHNAGNYILVNIDESVLATTLVRVAGNQNVEWVVPNFEIKAFTSPLDIFALKDQWSIAKVQAEKAWTRASNKGKKNIIIAVIDTGVDYKHKNLAPNMVPGYDFRDNDADPMDETSDKNPGHGTHCSGIAAGSGLIEGGIVGLGPEVSIMPIRFLGSDGSGDLNAAIKALDFAVEKGATVISASWGAAVPRSQATALIEAIQRADSKGVIFVAAAANDGANNDTRDVFPANSGTPNMISVAASSSSDAKPSWSNFGKATVSLSAPGEKIMSTLPNDNYGELSGTSMATPLVSGLVAFLKSQDAALTGAQIKALLQSTGSKVGIETACNCRVDAFEAVDTLLSKKQWLVPAAVTIPEGGSFVINVMNGTGPFKFTSSNTAVLTVDDTGAARGVTKGVAQVKVTDANNITTASLDYNVGVVDSGDGGGGGGGDCPLGDPALCQIVCGIMPDLPFCK